MLFKDGGLATEFLSAHPRVRELAHELDDILEEWGLGPLVITDVMRTPEFYGAHPPPFSWHYVGCAADFRSHHLSPTKKLLVRDWLRKRFTKSDGWDILLEHPGQPLEHFHVEFEVPHLKDDWLAKHGAGVA